MAMEVNHLTKYPLIWAILLSPILLYCQPEKPISINTSKALFLYTENQLIVKEKGAKIRRIDKAQLPQQFWMDEGTCTITT